MKKQPKECNDIFVIISGIAAVAAFIPWSIVLFLYHRWPLAAEKGLSQFVTYFRITNIMAAFSAIMLIGLIVNLIDLIVGAIYSRQKAKCLALDILLTVTLLAGIALLATLLLSVFFPYVPIRPVDYGEQFSFVYMKPSLSTFVLHHDLLGFWRITYLTFIGCVAILMFTGTMRLFTYISDKLDDLREGLHGHKKD